MSGQIHKAIVAVMREVGAIGKGRKNEQQNYSFRGIEDIYNRVQPLFAQHGIYSAPKVIDQKRETGKTSKGGDMHYSILTVEYTFYAEDGSSIVVTVVGEGMDSGDKASNKALSAADKYAVCQLLKIPYAVCDPDQFSPEWSAPFRGKVSMADINTLKGEWFAKTKKVRIDDATEKSIATLSRDEKAAAFAGWVEEQSGREFDVSDFRQWTVADLTACNTALNPDPFKTEKKHG